MLRRSIATLVMAALAATGFVMLAGPAYAGCLDDPPLPDGTIRKVGGQFKGHGLECNLEPFTTVTRKRSPGQVAKYEVLFRNVASNTRAIRVYAGGAPSVGSFKTKVLKGTKDITEKVMAADFSGKVFRNIPPGGTTPLLTITIKVRNAASIGTEDYLHLLGQFANDGVSAHFDGVVAKVKVDA